MANKRTSAFLFLRFGLFSLLLAACTTVSTSGDYTLESGQTLSGNLVITSGNATLEEGSRVTGSVLMTSGNLAVDGQVDGDIVMSSGSVSLGPEAVVHGDIRSTSGDIRRADGAQVSGTTSTEQSTIRIGSGFFARLFGLVCLLPLALLGGLIFLVVLFARRQPSKVGPAGEAGVTASEPTPTQKMQHLKEMLDQGLITNSEYEAKKSEILEKF
jgi:cytoskeletal protein CcmA (bactofilin family)